MACPREPDKYPGFSWICQLLLKVYPRLLYNSTPSLQPYLFQSSLDIGQKKAEGF